jgi:hypothetical protein
VDERNGNRREFVLHGGRAGDAHSQESQNDEDQVRDSKCGGMLPDESK